MVQDQIPIPPLRQNTTTSKMINLINHMKAPMDLIPVNQLLQSLEIPILYLLHSLTIQYHSNE
jgi:hypothetical protein